MDPGSPDIMTTTPQSHAFISKPDQQTTLKKPQAARRNEARAIRQSLHSVTTSVSHPQTESPLFNKLPYEVRSVIYAYVLSEQDDHSRPVKVDYICPQYRPGHHYYTVIHTELLQTCRRIYAEAHAIPLRSATHHYRGSARVPLEHLYHMSSQLGANLYHLHDSLFDARPKGFRKFLLPHLKWRKITWTLSLYLMTWYYRSQYKADRLAESLAGLRIPTSCNEVTLEFEMREDQYKEWPEWNTRLQACRELEFERTDGSKLLIDEEMTCQFDWIGSGEKRYGTAEEPWHEEYMTYVTTRLCWRNKVPRRQYISQDHQNCWRLREHQLLEIRPYVAPFDHEFVSHSARSSTIECEVGVHS